MPNSVRLASRIGAVALAIVTASPGMHAGRLTGQTTLVGNDSFTLSFSGRFQFRGVAFRDLTQAPRNNELDFEFERARLVFSGWAYDPRLRFFVQLDGDNADRTFVNFKDVCVQYGLWSTVALRAGKWTLPNGLQETTSAFRQQMVDRSIANEFFNIDRGIGVGLRASRPRWFGELSVFNGLDAEDASANRRGDLDAHPAFGARVAVDPLGPFGDGESDIDASDRAALRLGLSAAYSRIDSVGGDELRPPTLRVASEGTPIADAIPGGAGGFRVLLLTAGTGLKFRGAGLALECFRRRVFDFVESTLDPVVANGFYLQGGYLLIPGKVEAAGRWSRVWGDEFPGHPEARSDEVGGALNYFVRGQDLKVSVGVTHLNGAP